MGGYSRLFGVAIKHSYYSDSLCRDFTIAPTETTAKWLSGHRCLLKSRANGIQVYIETGDNGLPRIAVGDAPKLSFELRLNNPDFLLFTDTLWPTGGNGLAINYSRQPGAAPTQKVLTPDAIQARAIFAKLEIHLNATEIGGQDFELGFAAKSARWVYYLVTNQNGADYSVVGPGAEIIWMQGDGRDKVFDKLAQQYPGMKRMRFVSPQPMSCQESGVRQIQLLFGGNTLIESLPNPSWRNFFQTEIMAGETDVDAIFHVVKYITNTTLTKV